MKDCIPWKRPLLVARKEHDEKEMAETNHNEQTTAPVILCLAFVCVCVCRSMNEGMEISLQRKGRWGKGRWL